MRTVYSLPLLYWTNVEYNMGMVAGSMGSLRPLIVKLVGHISSLSDHTPISAGNSGESGSKVAQKQPPWRVRGGSRVQGDSVLQTRIHDETMHVAIVVPMETIGSREG